MYPKRWPKRLVYARESIAPEINISLLRSYFHTNNPSDYQKHSWVIEEKCVYPHLAIKKLQIPHPLALQKTKKGYSNYGVFATEKIKAGVELGEYVGELLLRSRDYVTQNHHLNTPCSEYSWSILAGNLLLTIDCHHIANELAFVNDYRGINPNPNVQMKAIIHKGLKYYGYVTVCEIQKGEEILANYTPQKM